MTGSGGARPQSDAELLERAVEVHAKLFDRASAYTRGVVAVGYAAILGAWGFAKGWMPAAAHALAGLLLIVSVLVFVLWEVYVNVALGLHYASLGERLAGDPAAAPRLVVELENKWARGNARRFAAWKLCLIATVVTGLLGALIIAGCAIRYLWCALRVAL